MTEYLQNELIHLFKRGMSFAKKAQDMTSKGNLSLNELRTIESYTDCASSQFSAARSIYYSNIDSLKSEYIEDVLLRSEFFCCDILLSIKSGYALSWTDVEFEALEKAFNNLMSIKTI